MAAFGGDCLALSRRSFNLTPNRDFAHVLKSMAPTTRTSRSSGGRNRARRPRTGKSERMVINVSKEEKVRIERAAAKAGLSMARFIVERALRDADRVLSKPR